MQPSDFLYLVRNYTALTSENYEQLSHLVKAYPYAQVTRTLHARAAKDLQLAHQQDLLNLAATYATDRSVLKEAITKPKQETAKTTLSTVIPVKPESVEEKVHSLDEGIVKVETNQAPEAMETTVLSDQPNTSPAILLSGDALRDDLLKELNKLQTLKHEFEQAIDEFQHKSPTSNAADEPSKEPLILEIESTHTTLPIENPRQKEQLQIIEEFIKTSPIIPKPKPDVPDKDLAEESASLSDNVVSETLVQILLKQGRKDKAIDVLRKLIWKFPQKKAYFAAQIDELKR